MARKISSGIYEIEHRVGTASVFFTMTRREAFVNHRVVTKWSIDESVSNQHTKLWPRYYPTKREAVKAIGEKLSEGEYKDVGGTIVYHPRNKEK